MIGIRNYLIEKFQVSKNNIKTYTYVYHPKDKDELIECIKDKIQKEGLGTKDEPLNLNDIDTSNITDMTYLFDTAYGKLYELSLNGYFDISDWNVSNVKSMRCMFYHSKFNGDISDWDVSNVEDMDSMFRRSKFNGDLSSWNVKNVKNMSSIFYQCPMELNPPKWHNK